MKTLHEWLDYIGKESPVGRELRLPALQEVAKRLKLLPPAYSVITVAGTNGKGTTASLLELTYRKTGYKTGLLTSPHLMRFNERIVINGEMVEDQQLVDAFTVVDKARGNAHLSYFEYATLAALLIFRDIQLDVVILEVGLGGRLDAVNIVDPDVAVVTTIDLDHTNWLGETREEVGQEKAGIFRPMKPAICGDLDCPQSVIDHAEKIGSPLYRQGIDYAVDVSGEEWSWRAAICDFEHLPIPNIPLQNAATALMVLHAMRDERPVDIAAYKAALRDLFVPGRFQVINQACPVILDVAHNVEACMMLVDNLKEAPCGGKTFAVFSSLADKDVPGMLAVLKGHIDHWFVAPLVEDRGCERNALEAYCDSLPVNFYDDINQAYHAAITVALPSDRIVVFGSFYVLSTVMGIIQESCGAK